MFSNKQRQKIIAKLAQTTNLPTDQVATTQTVSGNPQTFLASANFPAIVQAFGAKNVPWIDGLTNLLNMAMFFSTNGQFQMQTMKGSSYSTDASQFPSAVMKNIINFAKQLYSTIFTGLPENKALTLEEIANKINVLKQSQYLNALPQVNPSSQLASKIGGNLKTLIINYLNQIK